MSGWFHVKTYSSQVSEDTSGKSADLEKNNKQTKHAFIHGNKYPVPLTSVIKVKDAEFCLTWESEATC